MSKNHHHALSFAGLIITVGIIFGDIGTSPLYVLKAIAGDRELTEQLILGGLSCVFWTLTLQTTIKYVIITLRADNKGEGGIFSLYTLVRQRKKWIVIPAMIGGAALLADGIITPPVSVSSAIEGLTYLYPEIQTLPIIIGIIVAIFVIQQFGTSVVGKAFGPVMLIWFLMLGGLGIMQLATDVTVLKALNPYYAYDLLVNYPQGFWLLGAVFLCTTGAEALYSDLGHCGKQNIRVSWIFVKTMLVINYFGQGTYLMHNLGKTVGGENPFFLIVPDEFRLIAIIIATAAAIVASQALISGSFTLINEAIRLNLWPRVQVRFPSNIKGQIYIPSVNWFMMLGCIGMVLYFRKSENMEAAYGLSIVLAMISTTVLLYFYMVRRHWNPIFRFTLTGVFLIVEGGFLIAQVDKFPHGGYITLILAATLICLMFVIFKSKKIRNSYVEYVKIKYYLPLLQKLSIDDQIPTTATHLVYLTSSERVDQAESKIFYSILEQQPKRAERYWFVHVITTDEPYTMEYKVTKHDENDLIRIDFRLGFRVQPKLDMMFRQVVGEMVAAKEIDIQSRYACEYHRSDKIGDFRFVIIRKFLSNDNELPWFQKIIMNMYFFIKGLSLTEKNEFGLDPSSYVEEKFPYVISKSTQLTMKRID
ncbi:KUP/HAK/KT family potassium transporter [Fluviicola taffensis]|uniref:Probable potassium transport system protein Kup n=1 Tax=Fluviicola taffensis (strain DSM 16823 / NCIMB 13979 / RW262) TaxID=755732 RepID=F2IFU7_FLUTR|nr:KUP/HAK/KT family potassium transporter [Fluviicola taffensis]AEA42555.1 Low affinity potassium transport system protein kup [Fluviicola taffensis DSM 16823]